MDLPASEINGWIEYFEIYPFTQDREDWRFSVVAELLNNTALGVAYKGLKAKDFIPHYLGKPEVTIQSQIEADIAFANKLREMQAKANQ